MAESRESSEVDKSKTDFLNRVQKAKLEIKTKFKCIRKDLDKQEAEILNKVDEIQQDVIENYSKESASLKEISQVRAQVLIGLKSNATSKLLKKNLKMYDDEMIKEIQKNYNIDSTIKLVWKLEQLESICEVSSSVGPSSQVSRNSDIPTPSRGAAKRPRERANAPLNSRPHYPLAPSLKRLAASLTLDSKTSGMPKKRPLSSYQVDMDDSIPPVKIVKISKQSTKKISIISPPNKSTYESILSDFNCDSDSELIPIKASPDFDFDSAPDPEPDSDFELIPIKASPDFDFDSAPDPEPNSNSEPDPEPNSNSEPDPEPDSDSELISIKASPDYYFDSDSAPDPEPNSNSEPDPEPDSDSEPDPEPDSDSEPDPEPDSDCDSD